MVVQLFRKDTLSIELYEDTIFLHPTPESTEEDLEGEIVRGTATLVLNQPRRIHRLKIQLKGSILTDYRYETSTTVQKDLVIDLKGDKLDKGTYTWSWSFVIPTRTAVQERSNFGNIRHTVNAWCEGSGAFGSIAAFPRPVWLIASPCPRGELPSGLEVMVRSECDEVGWMALQVSAPHFTVASLCFMNVTFLNPPSDLEVLSVQASILQSFEIASIVPGTPALKPPRQKKTIFYCDQTTPLASSPSELLDTTHVGVGATLPTTFESRLRRPKPLVAISKGEEWSYSRIVRLPDDDHIRPTTLEHTSTPIRVSHQLAIEVRYRLKGSKDEKTLECSTDVKIASCCCLAESLLLPSYVCQRPKETKVTPFHRRCACNLKLDDMVKKDGESLCGAASTSREASRERGAETGRSGAETPPKLMDVPEPSDRLLRPAYSRAESSARLALARSRSSGEETAREGARRISRESMRRRAVS